MNRKITDPVEKIIADAMDSRGLRYYHESEGCELTSGLDFKIIALDVYVECKQFHTPRITEQMARVKNCIVVQGIEAAHLFANTIRR